MYIFEGNYTDHQRRHRRRSRSLPPFRTLQSCKCSDQSHGAQPRGWPKSTRPRRWRWGIERRTCWSRRRPCTTWPSRPDCRPCTSASTASWRCCACSSPASCWIQIPDPGLKADSTNAFIVYCISSFSPALWLWKPTVKSDQIRLSYVVTVNISQFYYLQLRWTETTYVQLPDSPCRRDRCTPWRRRCTFRCRRPLDSWWWGWKHRRRWWTRTWRPCSIPDQAKNRVHSSNLLFKLEKPLSKENRSSKCNSTSQKIQHR